VSWYIGRIVYMRVSGKAITEMGKAMNDTAMAIFTKVISSEERLMVRAFIIGQTVKAMMVSGRME